VEGTLYPCEAPAKSCSCMWRTHCQVKFLLHKRGQLCFVFQKWLASFLPCDTHSQALLKYPSSFLREFLCLLFTLAPIMSLPLLKSRHEISPPPMPQEILKNPPPPRNEVYPMHFSSLSFFLPFFCPLCGFTCSACF